MYFPFLIEREKKEAYYQYIGGEEKLNENTDTVIHQYWDRSKAYLVLRQQSAIHITDAECLIWSLSLKLQMGTNQVNQPEGMLRKYF